MKKTKLFLRRMLITVFLISLLVSCSKVETPVADVIITPKAQGFKTMAVNYPVPEKVPSISYGLKSTSEKNLSEEDSFDITRI